MMTADSRNEGLALIGTRRILCPALVLAALWTTACGAPERPGTVTVPDPAPSETSIVVMVSFDGMGNDFLDRTATPSFQRVADAGVRARGLVPGYPSKTFPNHYGIATGLYPAHHGLVDNTFYDPVFDATYSIGNRDAVQDGRWYRGEPIWVTAETQGVTTASFFWVGTEAPIQGVQPTYFKYYDESVPFAARVDTVLHWLSLPPRERPRLIMLYFHEPDGIAHERRPDHPDVDAVVRELDGHLGRLLDGIDALPVADRVTVILVSDHGMALAPADNVVYLDDYADLDGVRLINNSTQSFLYFGGDTARLNQVHQALDARMPRATVHRKGETPVHWHYDQGRRIGDLVVAAELGWVLRLRDRGGWSGGGMHGWDPAEPAMHGIFLAAGPRIRAGEEIPAFENVHIYPFVAHLLGLSPAAGIDGRLDVLEGILEPGEASP